MIYMEIDSIVFKIANSIDYSILNFLKDKKFGANRDEIANCENINLSSVNIKLINLVNLGILKRIQKPSNSPSRGRKPYIYFISSKYKKDSRIDCILEQIQHLIQQFS